MIYKLQSGGIIKLQNAGSVPQVDNTRVSKPLMKYQTSTVEQDHDALVKWNLEHPNDKVYRIEDLIQKEKEANPSWVKRAANLAVNPVPTSNFGMMSVPNPDSPVRSTVKDELGVAMTAASIPMIGSELGIYGGLGAGLRFGTGSAAAAGTSYIGGKAGDWLDDKLGTNWIGDTNRLVLPFITFPVGMKGANSVLRSAAGHGITMGMPQETFGALRGQYFNNRSVNTGNRYFGTNFNKLYKQAISDVYGYDKFINDNVNISPIQATSKNGVNRLIHWDKNSTGAPTDPIKHVHWEDGKITPAKTKIYVKGEPGVMFTVVEGDQHPIFWGGNKAWWEGPNGNTLDQHFGDIEFFKKRHSVQLPDLKQNFIQTNPTTKNGRFLIIDNPDQQLFKFNHYTGSTTGAISPSTLTDAFEYNPLTKTWARVKYHVPQFTISPQEATTTYHFNGRTLMNRSVNLKDPNLLYHMDYGDNAGAFQTGSYIKNRKLYPGINTVGQTNYSWWNLGKPYSMGVNEKPFTRMIITGKDNPAMIHVRSQQTPIGQWNGRLGFVTNSEYVASDPVENISVYNLQDGNWVKQRFQYQSPTTTVITDTPKKIFDPYDRFVAGNTLVESLERGNVPPIDAHGISKGNELKILENILQYGIDKNRRFDTAPLFKVEGVEGSSSGWGTGSGTVYNDGQFILVSKPNATLKNGIDAILINDADPGYANFLKQALQEKYPNFKFMTYGEAPNYYGVKKLNIPEQEYVPLSTKDYLVDELLPEPPEEIHID